MIIAYTIDYFNKLFTKRGKSEINYINIFQNSKALEISVGKSL